LPEVVAASAYFVRAEPGPKPRVLTADARRFVRTTRDRYDVIVADNFHPARSGSGSLYTVEHFAAVRDRLADGGVFCQWLPLHQLDLDTLRSIVRTFLAVYPRAAALLATNSLDTPVLGLVARNGTDGLDPAGLSARLAAAAGPLATVELGIPDELALLGAFVAGPRALERFAADTPLNTDDLPVVAYRAPRITYAPDSRPRDRLIALLRELEVEPDELLAAGTATAYRAQLAAYWNARNRFLEAGRDARLTADVRTMLAQVRAPLLAVLAISPEFRPAYDPLLQMAVALETVDAAGARDLLTELANAQPARHEAVTELRRLAEGPPGGTSASSRP
jgi:spermidine synthase